VSLWKDRDDVAAACGVPVDWVPLNYDELSDEDLVYAIEDARDVWRAERRREHLEQALRRSALYRAFGGGVSGR